MGLFDDIPVVKKTGGLFDDIPNLPPQVAMPQEPGAVPALGTFLTDAMTAPQPVSLPQEAPVPAPQQVGGMFDDIPVVGPAGGVDITDRSTAPGDLTAGLIQMSQFFNARAAGGAIKARSNIASERGEPAYRNAEADALEAEIPNLPIEDQAFAREQVAQLRQQAVMSDPYMTGREDQLATQDADALETLLTELPILADKSARAGAIPINPAAADVLSPEGDGLLEQAGNIARSVGEDPGGVFRTLVLRSLPAAAPTIASAVAGTALLGPPGAAAGAGAASFETERNLSIAQGLIQAARAAGVEPSDPAALRAWIESDPKQFDQILQDARTRGGIIGAFDAATGGLGGMVARAAAPLRAGRRAAVTGAAGTVLDPVGGASGEAGAQLATEGEISSLGDVAAEAIGGLGAGGPTIIAQSAIEAQKTPGRELGREMSRALREGEVSPDIRAVRGENRPQVITAPNMPPEPERDAPPVIQGSPDVPPVSAPVPQGPAPVGADNPPAAQGSEAVPVQPVPGPEGRPAGASAGNGVPDATGNAKPAPSLRRTTVYTADNKPIEVETAVVEADTLLTSDQAGYPAELQPRDRDRAASQTQIEGIANAPTPARLDQSPESDRGAPIVGPDGSVVESGNGRVMGLRRAYERGTAEEYRAYIEQNYPEAVGMKNPVIVRRRITETNARQFASVSNQSATLQMSATEIARDDARMIDDAVLGQYKGGPVGNTTNRGMIRAFISKLPQSAQGSMITAEGGLTIDGQRRFQNALFHRAYGDDRMLARLAESTDDDLKSVTGALLDASGKMAQLGLGIERGEVSPDVDISRHLMSAIQTIADFRAKDMDLKGFRDQIDAFAEPMDPIADQIMSALFNPAGTRMVSKKAMQDFLDAYATKAADQKIDQMALPGVKPKPVKAAKEIVDEVTKSAEPEAETGSLFDAGPKADRGGTDRSGPKERRAVDGPGREDADSGSLADAGVRRDNTGRRPRGKLSPKFLNFSFSDRTSVYGAAFKDAGIDPVDAKLMDEDKQIDTLSKMLKDKFGVTVTMPKVNVVRKNLVGRKVTEQRRTITTREALDQLLDAYRQMQMLASIMGLPEKAIGLELNGKGIELSLVGKGRLGALGMFSWGNGARTITLPGRSNSFAHEWGHALDHYLNARLDQPALKGMLSRNMDKRGVRPPLSPQYLMTEAFAALMWATYGDSQQLGALTLKLQTESVQVGADLKPTPKALAAQKILNDMKQGKRPPAEYLGAYFKSSADYDKSFNDDGYFIDAAEMFARAFEAWVGVSVAQVSDLPQSFLSKGDWAYTSSADDRLQKTFPKGEDMDQFAAAMTRLNSAMGHGVLFSGAKALTPEDVDIFNPQALLKRTPKTPIWAREMEELRRSLGMIKAATSPKLVGEALTDGGVRMRTFYQQVINTTAAAMYAVADRQKGPKAREAFLDIAQQVAKRPGQGKFTGSIYQEDVMRNANQRLNKIEGAVKRNIGIRKLTDADLMDLKLLLSGETPRRADTKLRGLAADLRGVLDEIWYDLKSAGIEVGYAKGYLPHIYDVEKMDADPKEFTDRAQEVYELMFEREVVNNADEETQIKDMNAVINGLNGATKSMPDGDKAPAPRLTDDQNDKIEAWRAARRDLKATERALESAKRPETKTKLTDKIATLEADIALAKEEILQFLQEAYGRYSAEMWQVGMRVGQMADYGSIGPTAKFMQKRVLPREAGVIMQGFMVDNPIDLISGYAFAAARRAEWAKRFGDDNGKLKAMLSAAADGPDGATEADIDMMKMAVDAAGGRMTPAGRGWTQMRSFTFTMGNLSLLTFAAFSSLAEGFVVGMRTGYARDGLRQMVETLRALASSGRREDLKEIARTIGLIAPYSMDQLMQNRLGADALGAGRKSEEAIQRFFLINGLTPLTHFQRIVGVPVAHSLLLRLLREDGGKRRSLNSVARDTIAGGKGKFADGELNEVGIAKSDRAALLEWLEGIGDIPRHEDLFAPGGEMHPAAALWARAVNRISAEAVQNPLKTDRPMMANHPDYAALYGIMSFIDAFSRNILERSIRRGIAKEDGLAKRGVKMTANIALTAVPFGLVFMGHLMTTALREALLNSDKWEELAEDDDPDALMDWLIQRAFFRTGILGRIDPLYQMYNGVKYERDLTAITAGPYLGSILQNIMTIMRTSTRNSGTNNTAEFNAAQAAYRLAVQPALALAISTVGPAGPISANLSRWALYKASAHDTSAGFAEKMVGEKGTKYDGDPPDWELGE